MNGGISRLRPAAIALLVVGIVNLGTSLLFALVKAFGNTGPAPTETSERLGYLTAQYAPFLAGPAGVVTTVAGALLLTRRNRRLGQIASAIVLIPGVSCCFVAGIPVGIWCLVVLARPDVKALFEQGPQPQPYPQQGGYPPYGQPPPGYPLQPYPQQGYPPQQTYPPQAAPQQGPPQQGPPQQGHPPQGYPPQQQPPYGQPPQPPR